MIIELKLKDFTTLIVNKLEELSVEVALQNPTSESKFPCYIVQTPLRQDKKTDEGVPVKQRYSIAVEHWASKKYDVMSMSDETDVKLRELNFTRTGTLLDTFDEITKKYRLITNYEVNYNGLYNSFELVK